VIGLLACLGAGVLRADEEADDAARFDSAVERIHADCRKERFDAALRKLRSLLERHEGRGYARARRAELEDLAERIAFGLECDAPSVEDVLSGRVQRWDCEKGYLDVRWTDDFGADLTRESGGWLRLPVPVTGPFLLEVTGTDYPDVPSQAPRMILLGGTDEGSKRLQSWLVVFGTPEREIGDRIEWMPARIIHRDGDQEKELVKLDKVPIKAGARFRVQMKVTNTLITAGINGKTMFNRRRPRSAYGLLGFDVRGWTEVRFAGTIEPSWIQARIDHASQSLLEDFRKRYQRTRYLPAWLFDDSAPVARPDATAGRPAEEEAPEPASPVEVDPKLKIAVKRARALIDKRDFDGARRRIDELGRSGAPPALTAHLAACVSVESGEVTRGLGEVDRCLQDAPDFLDALLLKARLLGLAGRDDEAYRTFRYAIKHHRQDPRPYETAAIAMLGAARPEEAQALTEMAAQNGVTSHDLELVARVVVKATRGPMWNKTFEYRSRNYHVVSDISRETCVEAAKILEEALTAYRVNLDWVTRDKTRLYPVYIFSGKQGFHEYLSEFSALMGEVPDQVAGLYLPLLKQLALWHLPEREEMLDVIRHEGFHQYLDRLMPEAPIWFNEGLAVYHETAVNRRGKLHFGEPHPYYLKVLGEKELVPLETFLSWSRAEFYEAAPLSYAEAWAFMHLLKEGKPRHRDLFARLLEEFQTKPVVEVVHDRLSPIALKPLQAALEEHVAEMRGQ